MNPLLVISLNSKKARNSSTIKKRIFHGGWLENIACGKSGARTLHIKNPEPGIFSPPSPSPTALTQRITLIRYNLDLHFLISSGSKGMHSWRGIKLCAHKPLTTCQRKKTRPHPPQEDTYNWRSWKYSFFGTLWLLNNSQAFQIGPGRLTCQSPNGLSPAERSSTLIGGLSEGTDWGLSLLRIVLIL